MTDAEIHLAMELNHGQNREPHSTSGADALRGRYGGVGKTA